VRFRVRDVAVLAPGGHQVSLYLIASRTLFLELPIRRPNHEDVKERDDEQRDHREPNSDKLRGSPHSAVDLSRAVRWNHFYPRLLVDDDRLVGRQQDRAVRFLDDNGRVVSLAVFVYEYLRLVPFRKISLVKRFLVAHYC
jgi:hypothetical protein